MNSDLLHQCTERMLHGRAAEWFVFRPPWPEEGSDSDSVLCFMEAAKGEKGKKGERGKWEVAESERPCHIHPNSSSSSKNTPKLHGLK